MPVPYTQTSTGGIAADTDALATWPNAVYADIASVIPELNDLRGPSSQSNTYTAGKPTQVVCGLYRYDVNWTGTKISTIVLKTAAGVTIYTYTPTYTGRRITSWARS